MYLVPARMSSGSSSSWVEVKSKSRPGEVYYYNKVTNKSSWKPPPEFKGIAKSAENGASTSKLPKKVKFSKLTLQSNNNGNMENAHPLAKTSTSTEQSLPAVSRHTDTDNWDSERDMGEGDVEEMECEERWGEEGEVSMDVDLSEAQQEELITEISRTRETLVPATSLESFDLSSGSTPLYQEMLYFVLDTNVLISHCQFLVELKDYAIKGVGRPVLVIPWAVMQELDALKTRDNQSLASKARHAIAVLHSCFSANHPRVRGQTMEEVQTESGNAAISNNDDRILHCCMLFQTKVKGHGGLVVLFSNDIQLCSKALLNGVRALNRKTLLNELRILCKSVVQAPPTSYTHTNEYASRVAVAQKQAALATFVDDLLCQSETIVREGLAAIIKTEMIEAYDNLWVQVVIVKPPWSLKDLVHILDKHWIAVFGHVVDRSLKRTVDGLSSYVASRALNIGGMVELETFHRLSAELMRGFGVKSDYGGVIPHCLTQLSVLSQKGLEVKAGNLPDPHPLTPAPTPSPAAPVPPLQLQVQHHPNISPTKLPPTPPATPGLPPIPFFSLSPTPVEQLVQNIPPNPQDQLPWLLNVVLETIKHCHSRLLNSIQEDKSQVASFLSKLTHLLASLVAAMNSLLRSQLNINTLREMVRAFDDFLANTLVVEPPKAQAIKFCCPLTLSQLYELLRDSESHRQLMKSAFAQFTHYLDVLNLLHQSL